MLGAYESDCRRRLMDGVQVRVREIKGEGGGLMEPTWVSVQGRCCGREGESVM